MKVSLHQLAITGIATALPSNKLEMLSLGENHGKTIVKRIIANTGIESVRVGNQLKTSDLCMAASAHLIEQLKINPKTIDAIVFVSQTPDLLMPATSAMMQHRLGLSTHTVAFDINYGCSGYVYGLYQAAMLISSGGCKRVLLCTGDVVTPYLHPNDYQRRMLLGDAGSATLIECGEDQFSFVLNTDGSSMDHLKIDNPNLIYEGGGYLHMDGLEISAFALQNVPVVINKLLDLKGWKSDDVGTFALHQANAFMLHYLRKKMRLKKEMMPIALEDVGNTGSASIPLTLSLLCDQLKLENRLDNVVMCGFGVGLSWAAAGMNLSHTKIFNSVEI